MTLLAEGFAAGGCEVFELAAPAAPATNRAKATASTAGRKPRRPFFVPLVARAKP